MDGGIILIKIGLESSDKEQTRRFEARMEDPLRQWKLSPMDLPSREKWFEYSRARDLMLKATDTKHAPWHILRSDDKKRARLNAMRYVLQRLPFYERGVLAATVRGTEGFTPYVRFGNAAFLLLGAAMLLGAWIAGRRYKNNPAKSNG